MLMLLGSFASARVRNLLHLGAILRLLVSRGSHRQSLLAFGSARIHFGEAHEIICFLGGISGAVSTSVERLADIVLIFLQRGKLFVLGMRPIVGTGACGRRTVFIVLKDSVGLFAVQVEFIEVTFLGSRREPYSRHWNSYWDPRRIACRRIQKLCRTAWH